MLKTENELRQYLGGVTLLVLASDKDMETAGSVDKVEVVEQVDSPVTGTGPFAPEAGIYTVGEPVGSWDTFEPVVGADFGMHSDEPLPVVEVKMSDFEVKMSDFVVATGRAWLQSSSPLPREACSPRGGLRLKNPFLFPFVSQHS